MPAVCPALGDLPGFDFLTGSVVHEYRRFCSGVGGLCLVGGRGIQISLLCVVLKFMFPPLSQLIFASSEPQMGPPFFVIALGLGSMYLGGVAFGELIGL